MTNAEYKDFQEELRERFYWTGSTKLRDFLTKEKGHRYLFRCTHYSQGTFFWVFDNTDELKKSLAEYDELKKQSKSEPKEDESIADGE